MTYKRMVRKMELWPISKLLPYPTNPMQHPPDQIQAIARSIADYGFCAPILAGADGEVVAGHGRLEALKLLGWREAPVVVLDHLTPAQRRAYLLADNQLARMADWDLELLASELQDLDQLPEIDVRGLGWDDEELANLLAHSGEQGPPPGYADRLQVSGNLIRDFVVPPFTVLDARQGYWIERKRLWLDLGFAAELGRVDRTPGSQPPQQLLAKGPGHGDDEQRFNDDPPGTSIFDPVLAEIVYRWFGMPGGSVLDPFAGGSVRGIVAAALGHNYTGVELREEQVTVNRRQYLSLGYGDATGEPVVSSPAALTPVRTHGGYLVKRDDLFEFAGMRGGKVRTCLRLAQNRASGGLVTAGSRHSPQGNIVAHVASVLGVQCDIFTPAGDPSPELVQAIEAGAVRHQVKPGHNSVIIARARDWAEEHGATEIPFGMECLEAVQETARQVGNLPWRQFSRLVVPVGSGMSLAGILHGLNDAGQQVPVLGVCVGADPIKRLDKFAPSGWRDRVQLVPASAGYSKAVPGQLGDLELDGHYEAKCIEHLQEGDLLWVVGIRGSQAASKPAAQWILGDSAKLDQLLPDGAEYDLLFTCPPYYDLERYSDDPADLSNAPSYGDFMGAFEAILLKAAARLRPNRFAVLVVGDFRRKDGAYSGFVTDTILAMQAAGCCLYNDAVLLTPVGSMPHRARKTFTAARKLVKGHQNVLVFYKGDPAQVGKHYLPAGLAGSTALDDLAPDDAEPGGARAVVARATNPAKGDDNANAAG